MEIGKPLLEMMSDLHLSFHLPVELLGQNKTFIFYSSMQTLLKCAYEKMFFKMEETIQQYPANSKHFQLI